MNANPPPVFVTKPSLPPLEEFIPYLREIWDSSILTNSGPFHQRFEAALCRYLGVEHVNLFVNGTVALLTALQALRIAGEVITTPFSFVATSHVLLWNGVKPVFVDIGENTMNMDPGRIEAAITPRTTAILAVHCYGRPCDVHAIQDIADRYNLKVIYDAAHAFGVKDEAGSILRHGDLSVLSFHATKVFNTFEGGAIVCPDEKTKKHIDYLKNFGHADEVTVVANGINGKMNEFCAALGLLQLEHVDRALTARKAIDARYREKLADTRGIHCLEREKNSNHAYFPILIKEDYPVTRDELYRCLQDIGIRPRRYFYPLISEFPMYRGLDSARVDNLPVATRLARQVLCLPIYPGLELSVVDAICDCIAGRG
ncbi:MAG: DegT/DnrJ/EryC1/StrS family aminotransferase [Zoogloeaceae bacterium]|nr:DegT/DnrJ/EryC1/StrS family aminotransferase [Zoogloeaceae bacterium]